MHFLDRGRPSSPFVSGSRWWIQQHEPLLPFGSGYKIKSRRGEESLAKMRKEQLPQSIYCLANQPPGTGPPSSAPRLEIEIGEALRPLLTQGSHIVACRVIGGTVPPVCSLDSSASADLAALDSSSVLPATENSKSPLPTPSPIIVAKIFDPLYYYHNGDLDIVELADMEYCREAFAYRHLMREGVDGKFLPAYYGSYSLEVPLSEDQKTFFGQYMGTDHPLLRAPDPFRRVHLILMERIDGQPMTSQLMYGDVNGLSDEARLDVVASTLEAYSQLYFHGIAHGDLAPRNVFLEEFDLQDIEKEGPAEHVDVLGHSEQQQLSSQYVPQKCKLRFYRFVDLGLAHVLGSSISALARQSSDELLPRNPIRLFWNVFESGAVNMHYWLPPKMRSTDRFQRWMLQRWFNDARFESIGAKPLPVKDDLAWDRGEAIANETWPDAKGLLHGLAAAGDVKRDMEGKTLGEDVRGVADDGLRRSDGCQAPSGLFQAKLRPRASRSKPLERSNVEAASASPVRWQRSRPLERQADAGNTDW
ncbi:hypothetical protein SEPCBS119000_003933 [Sporothrix epigloea]|uniref:Protein kinase domain-containing protein n=1 Tax=Sporothrix epigloea TaxID=1892477 RepID=A0ABP0DTG1_9PEZI